MVGHRFPCWVTTIAVMLLIILALNRAFAGAPEKNATDISLYAVLTHQTKYDGKLISVSGFICLKPDYPAIFLSYKGCAKPNRFTGIGLFVNSEVILKREEYGHETYGAVKGVFHTLRPGYVSVDSGLGGAWLAVKSIKSYHQSFAWSFSVIKPMSKKSAAYSQIQRIANTLIEDTVSQNYDKLAKLFVPTKAKAISLYISDLQNDKTRLGWVFFGAPHSIRAAAISSENNNNDKEIEVYLAQEPDEYLACISLAKARASFQPSVSYLLEGGKKFCFRILHGKFLDVGDFLYE